MTMQLPPSSWEINGDALTVWANDLEVYDVRPADPVRDLRPGYITHYNHVGHAVAVYLGHYHSIAAAQSAARYHLTGASS